MRRYLIYLLPVIFVFSASAQEIKVTANYPPVVTAGESFAISWNVNAGGGKFNEPSFTGFQKLFGPQTSFSSSTQIVNGKFSQAESNTFTYYLQAISTGRFVIPPATVIIKNKEYRSDSIYIEVVEGEQPGQQARQPAGQPQAETAAPTPSGELSVRINLSKLEVYQGEPVVATIKLYSRIGDQFGGLSEVKLPDFKGFLNESIDIGEQRMQRENVGGTVYETGVIQQFLLFPQVTGDLTIDPVQITAVIRQRSPSNDPFFGFFEQYQNVPRAIASKPVIVKVKPLPGPKPQDFSGLIGKVDMTTTLNRDSVDVNSAIALKVTISGTGNLRLAAVPALKLSPEIEMYEPKVTENIKHGAGGTTGQKIFEYTLIPRYHGDFIIPAITYSFFNPSSGRYETLTSRELRFFARKVDEQGAAATVYGGVSKEDVRYLGKDIRFIKSEYGMPLKEGKHLAGNRSFYSLYGLALLAFIIIIIARREHVRRNADIVSVRNRKAARIAGKRLKKASDCLKEGNLDQFHEEILKALWGYLSDKLGIPPSGLTRMTALEALKERGVEENLTAELEAILDKCEFARFAPSASGAEASGIYEGAANFIRTVENKR